MYNFRLSKFYHLQNLILGCILKIFLKFRKFQPRYSYGIVLKKDVKLLRLNQLLITSYCFLF